VAPCIPGCQGVEVIGPTRYKAKSAHERAVRKAAAQARCRLTIRCG
jgi:carbon monoxide dehydrogenase subunit G